MIWRDKCGKVYQWISVALLYRAYVRDAMKDVVMVFTSKSLATMQKEGGSGNWAANKDRLMHAKWIVATRNEKSSWAEGGEEHGSAFMIGRISGIKAAPSPEQTRFVVSFDRYASLSIANAWTGSRNPVTYTDLTTLGIDPESLQWKESIPSVSVETGSNLSEPSLVIDRARSMIAQAFSISPDAVKITVAL